MTRAVLDSSANNVNIDGAITEYVDFGGVDTYTILPGITNDIDINDTGTSIINLPEGLQIDSASFLQNGVRLEIGGHNVTLLGAPENFEYVFGGTPLSPDSGTRLSFEEMANAFGTSIPDGAQPNNATQVGTIQPDGTIGGDEPEPVIIDLDDQGGKLEFPATLDVGEQSAVLKDSVNAKSVVEIQNFGADDALEFAGVSLAEIDYKIQNNSTHFEIDDGNGVVSRVVLLGVDTGAFSIEGFNSDPNFGAVSVV